MQLKEKISFLRKRYGYSQQTLAEKLDVSRQTISKWEVGIATPSAEKLISISKMFHISIDKLIDDSVSMEGMETECDEEKNCQTVDLTVQTHGNGFQIAWQMALSILALSVVTFFAFDFVQSMLARKRMFDWRFELLPSFSDILQIAGCGVIGFLFGRKYRPKRRSKAGVWIWVAVTAALLHLTVAWSLRHWVPLENLRYSLIDHPLYLWLVVPQFLVAKVTTPIMPSAFLCCDVFFGVGALRTFRKRKEKEK